jgi:peptide/nickel transport system permease protein
MAADPTPGGRLGARRLLRWESALVVLLAAVAPLIAPYDPVHVTPDNLAAPNPRHPFGTDQFGRDVLSRILWGARLTLLAPVVGIGISTLVGVPLGLLAGYSNRWLSGLVMRVMDVMLAFPGLLLAIAVASALGPSLTNVMLAIALVNVPSYARLVRATVLATRGFDYVRAARALGASGPRVLLRHILPSVLPVVIVRATLGLGAAILTEAGLSFIGLGAQPPDPSWGGMLNDGRESIRRVSHLTTLPGLCIMMTVLAFNLLGDGLRDALDPRLKR